MEQSAVAENDSFNTIELFGLRRAGGWECLFGGKGHEIFTNQS